MSADARCGLVAHACHDEPGAPIAPPEVRLDEAGELDELVGPMAHLERMDNGHFFLEVWGGAGQSVAAWLHSRARIRVIFERRAP